MKTIRVNGTLRGGCILIMAVVGLECALGADTFTDDFNRGDATAVTSIGPGWLHATNATGPDYRDHWSLTSGRLRQGGLEVTPVLYCTNVSLLKKNVYTVSTDVMGNFAYNTMGIFANRRYMSPSPWVEAMYNPGLSRIMLRVVEPGGTVRDYPTVYDYDIATNVWYTLSLHRSNEFARVTLTGVNVAADTGWVSSYVRAVPYDGYAGLYENNYYYLDNFSLSADIVPQSRDGIFRDDFNRSNFNGSTNLGPGWLSGTNAIGFPYVDRWSVSGQTAVRFDGVSAAWANRVAVDKVYEVGMDVKWTAGAFNGWTLFANRHYMSATSYINAIHQPGLRRIFLRIFNAAGGWQDLPAYPTAASLTDGAWYRFTLMRSDRKVRATFVGADANLDTGWFTGYIDHIESGGYSGVGGNYPMYFDNFAVSNRFFPKATTITIK